MTDIYSQTNKLWIDAGVSQWDHRPLTVAQARKAKRTLWRIALGRWPRNSDVRPVWQKQGIKRLVHDVSHSVWRQLRPAGNRRHHCIEHASWERSFTQEAIKRGWHQW